MAHAEAPDRLDTASTTTGHPAPARDNVALWTLWFGFLGAPIAWSVQTLANTAVASHGCYPQLFPLSSPVTGGMRGILFGISVAAIIAALAALVLGGSGPLAFDRLRDHHSGRIADADGRLDDHAGRSAL